MGILEKLGNRDGPAFLSLEASRVTVGRHSSCDLILSWDGVSRVHFTVCALSRKDRWLLQADCDTTAGLAKSNGVFVNERRVKGSRILSHGDVVSIGRGNSVPFGELSQ